MTKEEYRYRAMKLILFPRLATIWDIFLITSKLSNNLEELLGSSNSVDTNKDNRLMQLSLRQMKSLFKRTSEGIIINSKDLSYWLENSYNILSTLIELNEAESAKAFFFDFISTFFFLLTVYAMKHIDNTSEMREFLNQFKFDENAIPTLLAILDDEKWNESLKTLGIIDLFRIITHFYAISIKTMLGRSDPRSNEKIFNLLDPFLRFSSEKELLDEIDTVIESAIAQKDYFPIRIILTSFTILLEGLSREILRENNSMALSKIKKYLEKIIRLDFLNTLQMTHRDLGILSLNTAIRILYDITRDNIEKAEKELREFGSILLKEKIGLIGVTERLLLKLPPETFSLPPPFTPPPIEPRDRLSSSSLLMVVNEILDEIISSGMERKNMMKIALILSPNNFIRLLFRSLSDPLASLGLMFLVGVPAVFLFEAIIFTVTQNNKEIPERVTNAIINALDLLLKAKDSILRRIENKYFKNNPDYNQIASFYLYRDTFLISLLMSDKIRDKLIKNANGRKLINTLEKIYKHLEKIYGKTPVIKREDISELFA